MLNKLHSNFNMYPTTACMAWVCTHVVTRVTTYTVHRCRYVTCKSESFLRGHLYVYFNQSSSSYDQPFSEDYVYTSKLCLLIINTSRYCICTIWSSVIIELRGEWQKEQVAFGDGAKLYSPQPPDLFHSPWTKWQRKTQTVAEKMDLTYSLSCHSTLKPTSPSSRIYYSMTTNSFINVHYALWLI